MTKANEIAILRQAIKLLGKDSYCGPWLASVVGEVESIIRSDFFPTVTLSESAKECEDIKSNTHLKAADLLEAAKVEAKRIVTRAEHYQNDVAEALRLALRNLTAV